MEQKNRVNLPPVGSEKKANKWLAMIPGFSGNSSYYIAAAGGLVVLSIAAVLVSTDSGQKHEGIDWAENNSAESRRLSPSTGGMPPTRSYVRKMGKEGGASSIAEMMADVQARKEAYDKCKAVVSDPPPDCSGLYDEWQTALQALEAAKTADAPMQDARRGDTTKMAITGDEDMPFDMSKAGLGGAGGRTQKPWNKPGMEKMAGGGGAGGTSGGGGSSSASLTAPGDAPASARHSRAAMATAQARAANAGRLAKFSQFRRGGAGGAEGAGFKGFNRPRYPGTSGAFDGGAGAGGGAGLTSKKGGDDNFSAGGSGPTGMQGGGADGGTSKVSTMDPGTLGGIEGGGVGDFDPAGGFVNAPPTSVYDTETNNTQGEINEELERQIKEQQEAIRCLQSPYAGGCRCEGMTPEQCNPATAPTVVQPPIVTTTIVDTITGTGGTEGTEDTEEGGMCLLPPDPCETLGGCMLDKGADYFMAGLNAPSALPPVGNLLNAAVAGTVGLGVGAIDYYTDGAASKAIDYVGEKVGGFLDSINPFKKKESTSIDL